MSSKSAKKWCALCRQPVGTKPNLRRGAMHIAAGRRLCWVCVRLIRREEKRREPV